MYTESRTLNIQEAFMYDPKEPIPHSYYAEFIRRGMKSLDVEILCGDLNRATSIRKKIFFAGKIAIRMFQS